MAVECVVITLIIAAIIFSFAHANRIRWILATLPLAILPFANSVVSVIYSNILKAELPLNVSASVILIATMVSCIWVGIASGFVLTKRMKIPYITVSFIFNIVLAMILLHYYINLA